MTEIHQTLDELSLKLKEEWEKVNKIVIEYEDEITYLKENIPDSEYLPWFIEKHQEATLARASLGLARLDLIKAKKKADDARKEVLKILEHYEKKVLKKDTLTEEKKFRIKVRF